MVIKDGDICNAKSDHCIASHGSPKTAISLWNTFA